MEERGWEKIVVWAALLLLAARIEAAPSNPALDAIEAGAPDRAIRVIEGRDGAAIDKSPALLLSICEAAARNAAWLLHGGREDAEGLADVLVAKGTAASEQRGGADAFLALAEARRFQARIGLATRQDKAAEHYRAAIDAARTAYQNDAGDGQALLCAVLAACEAVDAVGGDSATLLEEATRDVERLDGAHKATLAAAHASAALELALLERDLPAAKMSKEIAEVRDRAARVLGTLEGWAAKDLDAATTYNDAVSFILANRKKLPLEVAFVSVAKRIAGLHFRVPVSRRWRVGSSLYQFDRRGSYARAYLFDTYNWATEYTYGTKGIGGDNPKGLCTYDIDSVEGMFLKIKRRKKATKGRMNRKISRCYYFEMEGTDESLVRLRVSGWYFKADEKRLTYRLLMVMYPDSEGTEPAADFVVDSFTTKDPD